jgi:hypothetical protein
MYVLRAIDRAGAFGYYTGKAGPEYISNKIENSFGYELFDRACCRASDLYTMTGVNFVVIEEPVRCR